MCNMLYIFQILFSTIVFNKCLNYIAKTSTLNLEKILLKILSGFQPDAPPTDLRQAGWLIGNSDYL